ncbi:trypsin-like serine protease [Actinoplanes sp. ATCC 53533]|uniref:S1 family peptidase n=1 Tax=Actinoplanes sp. ATCC 53533 TaxID=1288362 RepID=UPI0013155129|nr:trypsin-like serine protease [Actinoplanes sp. ATCC 53533]
MTTRTWLAALASSSLALATALTVVTPAPASAAGDVGVNIIGGSDATESYPFAARTLTHYTDLGLTARCTASLVTVRGVIGVVINAHCISDLETGQAMPAADIDVQVGSTRLDQLTTLEVTKAVVNPEWDWATGTDRIADIAVMRVDPAGLALTGIRIGHQSGDHRKVRVLGWGKTSIDATQPPAVLQQLDTRLTARRHCATAGITAGEICVDDRNGAAPCFGDSGGPALGKNLRGTWVLLGSASRETSANCDGPTVYTDIDYWSDWITKALTEDVPRTHRHVAPGAAATFLSHVN